MAAGLQSATRYDRLSIIFHWATVLLLIAACASIEMRQLFARGTPARLAAKEWHYVLGVAILLMTMARLSHRFGTRRVTPSPLPNAPWLAALSKAMHWSLYAALIAFPILGIVTTSALGDPVRLLAGVELPSVMAKNREFGKSLEAVHVFLGNALYYLVGLHAVAALTHHFIWRDATLRRMLPKALVNLQQPGYQTR